MYPVHCQPDLICRTKIATKRTQFLKDNLIFMKNTQYLIPQIASRRANQASSHNQ